MANYPTQNLQPGMSGDAVKQLQNYLIYMGYSIPAGATGYYGDQTKAAVTLLQKNLGVDNSSGPGYWGPRTIAAVSSQNGNQQSTQSVKPSAPAVQTTYINQNTQQSYPIGVASPGYGSDGKPSSAYVNNNTQQSFPSGTSSPGYNANGQKIVSGPQAVAGGGYIYNNQSYAAGTGPYASQFPAIPAVTISPTQVSSGSSSNSNDLPGMPPGIQNLTVMNLPEEAFAAPTPSTQLIPGTPEYQAAMDKLDTSYFDILQQQLNASTEEQQQAAQYNWDQLKKYIESTLNINLSDNALNAWDQIQAIRSQAGAGAADRNISGSGIEAQSIDSYLRKVRAADAKNRMTTKNDFDKNQVAYYQQFATPAQIKALVDSNPELARQYGLIPSDEIKNSMSYSALKAKYPNMSDEQINANIASVLDENGNYRSALYQKYMTGSNLGVNSGTVDTNNIVYDQYGNALSIPVKPSDTGVLDIKAAKELYQAKNTPLASLASDDAARRALGSTPKSSTTATQNDPSSSTQFNKITSNSLPGASSTPAATVQNPIIVPNSMKTSPEQNNNQSSQNTQKSSTPNVVKQGGQQEVPQDILDKFNILKNEVNKFLSTMSGTTIKK